MHEQDLEQRIRTAVEHAAPDPLEQILAACGPQSGNVIPLTPPKAKKRRWVPMAVAAALVILACGGFSVYSWRAAKTVASVVSLDVNPSIQLQVNQKERILSAQPLNEDAQIILEGMDLQGTQLQVAVNAIMGSLLQHGYLDSLSSAILISVEDSDAQRASRLEAELTGEVDAALQNASAGAAVLSQVVGYDAALETQAQASGISVGKAAMVQSIQAIAPDLSFEDLAALSVEELKQLLETGAPGLPIGTSAAADAALAYAGLVASNAITWEVDPELDERTPHYEVELHTQQGEFDYIVDAWTGEVLRGAAGLSADVSGSSGSSGSASASSGISQDDATAIALADAGIQRASALGLRVSSDWDDGHHIYEVEFRSGGAEYEYDILASDGTILKAEREDDGWRLPAAAGTSTASFIGEDAAAQAALRHAGVTASAAQSLLCQVEYDDGLAECYEVTFQTSGARYAYEIGLYDGSVLKSERTAVRSSTGGTGANSGTGTSSSSGGTSSAGVSSGGSTLISAEQAQTTAFRHAGIDADDVYELDCELERDDGSTYYSLEFKAGRMEYDYEIDAYTGAVLSVEQDRDD